MSEDSEVWFLVEDAPEDIAGERRGSDDVGGGFGGPKRGSRNLGQRRRSFSASMLNDQMNGLIRAVNQMFHQTKKLPQPGLELEEVELAVEVNGEGKVSILGSGGKAGGKGAITLKFKRSSPVSPT
ncbi:MAG: hypothetical protein F6K19_46885 [Cyanothece sp. SIO1E1]|nr:hypothetical protein [Cyanothece sp. SIO1E1]